MGATSTFASLHCQGFVRVAAAVPFVRPADPAYNAQRTLVLAREASQAGAALVLFPELGLSAYAIDDLLHQQVLADGTLAALEQIVAASQTLAPVLIVGMPLWSEGGLFNAAVVIHRGRVLGAVPKSYLPEYREFYEKRQFRAARDVIGSEVQLPGGAVPFGPDLVFACRDVSGLRRARRDLRGRLGPDPPELVRRPGGRDRAGQPVGLQHHGRQVRLPSPAVGLTVGARDRRIPVHGGGDRRVHDRSGLGRTGDDL